ncbi:hypothetical protein GCM10020255_108330 [Rhodococcus baikonurensis]
MVFSIESVSKEYRSGTKVLHALDSVSLKIEDGEIFGIIGKSGAGKSTLLRCLNLLERPTSGRILLGDTDLTALSPAQLRDARKRIGVVFQHFNLLHSRSVAANIAFPLEVAGYSRADRRARVDELIELVGLEDRRDAFLRNCPVARNNASASREPWRLHPMSSCATRPRAPSTRTRPTRSSTCSPTSIDDSVSPLF